MELSSSNIRKFLIFSKESFSYILGNGNPPKILYISGGTSEISKTKVSLSTTSYTLPTRKNSTKGAINPLSASPAKWSKTLKQFVGWFIILIPRLQTGIIERLSQLGACGFKPNTPFIRLSSVFTRSFSCHLSSKESMIIIWFHNKIRCGAL